MKEISKAIIKVMQAVKGMEKNSNVGKGQNAYQGTKDQDVKEVFNTALADAGLCILPIDIKEDAQIDRWDALDYHGKPTQKQSVFTKVTVKYMLLHISGEHIELFGYGHGVDPQDKGAGKATTYALKNCLLYTFLTPVGKIDDTDTTHAEDINTPVGKTEPETKLKLTTEMAKTNAATGVTLASMMKTFEMSADQQSKYAKLLDNGQHKS
jgi:hypothetical protein